MAGFRQLPERRSKLPKAFATSRRCEELLHPNRRRTWSRAWINSHSWDALS